MLKKHVFITLPFKVRLNSNFVKYSGFVSDQMQFIPDNSHCLQIYWMCLSRIKSQKVQSQCSIFLWTIISCFIDIKQAEYPITWYSQSYTINLAQNTYISLSLKTIRSFSTSVVLFSTVLLDIATSFILCLGILYYF